VDVAEDADADAAELSAEELASMDAFIAQGQRERDERRRRQQDQDFVRFQRADELKQRARALHQNGGDGDAS
jgi:hypothetical protein